jgi:hypothetical protein
MLASFAAAGAGRAGRVMAEKWLEAPAVPNFLRLIRID